MVVLAAATLTVAAATLTVSSYNTDIRSAPQERPIIWSLLVKSDQCSLVLPQVNPENDTPFRPQVVLAHEPE